MTSAVGILEDLTPLVRIQDGLPIKYGVEVFDHRKEIERISDEINNKLVPHILYSNISDFDVIFHESIPVFGSELKKITSHIIGNVRDANYDFLRIARSVYDMYESLKKEIHIRVDLNYSEQLIRFFDNLRDYENILFGIIINRLDSLNKSLKEIDLDDLKNNIHGAFLAFVCTIALVNEKNYDKRKLQTLLHLGIVYSEELIDYIDTLDILSDPDTIAAINRSI